jgi:hypothetical protein
MINDGGSEGVIDRTNSIARLNGTTMAARNRRSVAAKPYVA